MQKVCERLALVASVLALSSPAFAQAQFGPGDIVISDTGHGRLVRVDPATGALSNIGTIGGYGVAPDGAGNLIMATSINGHASVVRVDPSGAYTVITQDGLILGFMRGLAVDPASGYIYVSQIPLGILDGNFWNVGISHPQILGISPATGEQRVVSDLPLSWSKGLFPDDLVVQANGTLALANTGEPYGQNVGASVVQVDPATGAETVLPGDLNNNIFGPLTSITTDWDGMLVLGGWTPWSNWGIYRVDPEGNAHAHSLVRSIYRSDYGQELGVRVDQNGDFVALDTQVGSLARISRADGSSTLLAPAGTFATPAIWWGQAFYLTVIPGGTPAPAPAPIGSYRFGEGPGAVPVELISAQPAQFNFPSGPRWSNSGRGGSPAIQLNGSALFTTVPAGAMPMSTEVWFHLDELSQQVSIQSHYGFSDRNVTIGGGQLQISFATAWQQNLRFTAPAAATLGWNQLVQEWTPTGCRTYLNAQLISSIVQNDVLPSTGDWAVGFGYPANAAIDELNFYQAELTPAQVAQKYAAGLSAKLQLSNPALPRIGVGGYAEVRLEANSGVPPYAFSAGAVPAGVTLDGDRLRLAPQSAGAFPLALTVTDASGATATRTLTLQVDAPTVVPAGAAGWWPGEGEGVDLITGKPAVTAASAIGYTAGVHGQGFSLGGQIDVGHADFHPQAFTVETWVSSFGQGYPASEIISKDDFGNEWSLEFTGWWEESQGAMFVIAGQGFRTLQRVGPGVWYHLAATYDGSSVKLYVNGQLDSQYAWSGTVPAGNSDIQIGKSFAGQIDEAAIYGRALGADEIRAIYQAGAAGKSTSGVAAPKLPAHAFGPAFAGTSYDDRAGAIYGTPPYTYALTAGALPPGLSLDGLSGAVHGAPTGAAGVSAFTLTATDALGATASNDFSIDVVTCGALAGGLIDEWQAEGNALDSFGARDGHLFGGAGYAPGHDGQAFSFPVVQQWWSDYSNDTYVETSGGALSLPTGTVEAWFNTASVNQNGGGSLLVAQGMNALQFDGLQNGPPQTGWGLGVNGYEFQFQVGSTDLYGFAYGSMTGAWHHVVATWDTAALRLYVDGAQVGQTPWSGAFPAVNAPIRIGQRYSGLIDGVTIRNRALSADEVRGLDVTGACPALRVSQNTLPNAGVGEVYPHGLNAFFGAGGLSWSVAGGALPPGLTLDPLTGALSGIPTLAGTYTFTLQVTDASGATATRTITLTVEACTRFPAGAVAYFGGEQNAIDSVSGAAGQLVNGAGFAPGAIGYAFAFDASQGQYVDAGNAAFHPKQLTVEAWIQPVSANQDGAILSKSGDAGDDWRLNYAGGQVSFEVSGATATSTVSVDPFTWRHVAGTFDGQTVSVYVDGVLQGQSTQYLGMNPGSAPIRIGANSSSVPGEFFDGFIDEPTIYTRVLAPAELAAVAAADADGKCHALMITTASLPLTAVGNGVPALAAAFGAPPYHWQVAGALPPGLAAQPDGSFAGAPSATGAFPITATVIDSTGATASRPLELDVAASILDPNALYSFIDWMQPAVLSGDPAGATLSLVQRLPQNEGVTGLVQDKSGNLYALWTDRSYDNASGIVRIDARSGAATPVVQFDPVVMAQPWKLLLDGTGQLIIVSSYALVRVDPASGQWTMLAQGGSLASGIWDAATAGRRLLVETGGADIALVDVDVTSVDDGHAGNQVVRKQWLQLVPQGVAEAGNGEVLISDSNLPGLWRVSLTSGQRTLVARLPGAPADVKRGPDGNWYVAVGASVYRIDLTNPDANSAATDVADFWDTILGIGFLPDGSLVYAAWEGVFTADGNSLDGDWWSPVFALANDSTGALVELYYDGQIRRWNADGSGWTTLATSASAWGCGLSLAPDSAGAFDIADQCAGGIIRTDAAGNSTTLSSGGNFSRPDGVAVEAGGTLLVSDSNLPGLLRVDPSIPDDGAGTNQTVLLQDAPIPSLGDIAVSAKGIAAVQEGNAIVSVDLISGAEGAITSNGYMTGDWMWPMWFDAGGKLLLYDEGAAQAIAVDVSQADDGSGSNQSIAFHTVPSWTIPGIGSQLPAQPPPQACEGAPVLPADILALVAQVTLEAPATLPAPLSGTATDSCDGPIAVAVSDASAAGAGKVIRIVTRTYSATNSTGKRASLVQTFTIQDTLPPVLSNVPADQQLAASSPAGATATWTLPTALDAVDGRVAVSCSPASGATFAPGITTVTCSATDAHQNSASAQFRVDVTFAWSGFLPPITSDGKSLYKVGRTIPVKFTLAGTSAPATGAPANLLVARVSNGIVGTYEPADSTGSADVGDQFRVSSGQYVFNLDTSAMAAGTWQLSVDLHDGIQRTVLISTHN